MRRFWLAVPLLMIALLVAPAMRPSIGSVPRAAAQGDEATIEIQDFQFSEESLEISVGTTVTWTNTGDASHTATSDDGSTFDSGTLSNGESFSFTFDTAGEFSYHCDIHARMKATIVVVEATEPATVEATEEPTEEATEEATDEPTEAATEEATAEATTEAPSGPATIVGGAADGSNALEYVGKFDQRGGDLTYYGYLTHVAGLESTSLFADADPTNWNESTARITFFGTAQLTSRASIDEQLIAVTAEGTLGFFFNGRGGASFDVPEGFIGGTKIADSTVSIHSVLAVYDTGKGITNADGTLQWTLDEPFVLDGTTVQLGKLDGRQRLTYSGVGTLLEPNEPRSTTLFGGNSVSIAASAVPSATDGGGDDSGDDSADSITIDLGELNDSGVSGTATLTANGDSTDVVLNLEGATGGHPAHIHNGTCNELDPNPAFPLAEVDADGHSETTVEISLTDLQAAPFAVNIHKSADEIGVYVACGNIE